ncbi:MAG: indole-3-glycerol phosphate synthase TrpC [Bacteroidota bacterium]
MNILDTIIEHKLTEIESRKRDIKLSTLYATEWFGRTSHSLLMSVTNKPKFSIIAELKRSSPSAGEMNTMPAPEIYAQEYQENGAAAISVLTDSVFFKGNLSDLENVRRSVSIPLLQKEFIIDEYQIAEARAYGADAILLIVRILDRIQIDEYFEVARAYGMECLVEIYDEKDIDKINFDKIKLVGVNNRDLRTMEIDINRTPRIAELLPSGCVIISESGIQSVDDLRLLKSHGIFAALIGELFMKSGNPGENLSRLLTQINA